MATNNPTALSVGMEGVIFGHRGTVVGRSVLKSGEGYRWDEYHLKLDDGSAPTLVYESGIWKRFDLFDPDVTLSAVDAADLGVGDPVTLGGCSAEIDYVGRSRVEHIEGRAPEGYRVGSEAHYFNAEAGSRMFVVSWTGDEVEFYEGANLPRGEVERAFGLPEPSLLARIFSGGSGGLDGWFESDSRLFGAVLATCGVIALVWLQSPSREATAEPPPPVAAPALRFPVKAQGSLAGHVFAVTGHRVNEIAEMRGRFGRHEYDLLDEQGVRALLVQGMSWDARQWYLFREVPGPATLWPYLAATYRQGSFVKVGGRQAVVRTLFLCRTIACDGEMSPVERPGAVLYGFTAQAKDGWFLACWNDADIQVLEGELVSDRDVRQAFGPGVAK